MYDRNVVWLFFNGFHKKGVEFTGVVFRGKSDTSAFYVGDVDIAGGSVGLAGGLEHGGSEGGAAGDLVEFLGAKVIGKHMEGEDILDGVDGEVFGEKVSHSRIIDGADGDGQPAVYVGCEVSDG